MNRKGVQVLIHVLAWLVFLSFTFIFFPKTKAFLPAEEIDNFTYLILPSSIASIAGLNADTLYIEVKEE